MAHEPAMYRLTERDGILHVDAAPSGFALERRQAVGGGGAAASGNAASSAAAATTTSAAAATTTTTAAAPATTTTQAATTTEATTTAAPSTTTTTTQATTSQPDTTTSAQATTTTSTETTTTTTSADSSTTTTSAARSTTTSAADTTVTRVITPTTVVVVGTSTFTSSLPPITSAETLSSSSQTALPASSGSGLSSGAIAGIAVGSAVGGIIALSLLGWLCLGAARRRRDKRDADNILWPATGDSSALYPEPVHNTGRAGFGVGDDGDDLDEGAGTGYGKQPGMSEVGAGAAGVGAAALGAGALGRYGSQREPQLPNVPPTVYTSEYGPDSYGADPYYGGGDSSPPEGASAYTGYSNQTPSQHSHSALAPGMAGMGGYGGAVAAGAGGYDRQSPSPPRVGGTSADGHLSAYDGESQGGHMPFPGEADHEGPERSLSPRPMQVGDTFGQGYDETEGGRRWRLSVVNDDPLDRD